MIISNPNNNPGQYNPYQPGAGLFGIPIVGVTSGNTVFDDFFIDPQSNFYAVKSGQGVIDKGLFFYAHDLIPSPNVPGGPGAYPGRSAGRGSVPTGLCDRWRPEHLVRDRQRLGRQAERSARQAGGLCGGSGAGADLPVKARPPAVVCAPQAGYGVWVKGIGSWTSRDDTQISATRNHTFTFDTELQAGHLRRVGAASIGPRPAPARPSRSASWAATSTRELRFDSSTRADQVRLQRRHGGRHRDLHQPRLVHRRLVQG